LLEKHNIKLKNVVIDFEIGLKNAITKVNQEAFIFGCNFHYGQSLWRTIQKLGMATEYKSDLKTKKILRMFLNLSFINPTRILEAFTYIVNYIEETKEASKLKNFIKYYKTNYFCNEHRKTLFDISFWSVHERILKRFPRTTNTIEAWHHGFNDLVNVRHPNI
jgi:hypothetical protein